MIKAYKYRIHPTKTQMEFLNKSFGCVRYIYNWALNLRIEYYNQNKTSLSTYDIIKNLTVIKKDEDKLWLQEPVNECLQQSIRNMDSAYTHFFKHKMGFPNFKSKNRSKAACKFINGVGVDFDNKRIKIPKCGLIKFVCDRRFEGKIGTLTITRSTTGRYYASFVVTTTEAEPSPSPVDPKTTVGIDVGIKNFAILSDGTVFENMKYLENNEKRLKVLQYRLSKKQKGSKRREEAKHKLAVQYERITNLRTNYIHQVTAQIIAKNQSIVIEDLNIAGMLKNHCLAKSISSVSWGEFFRQLTYKSKFKGCNLIKIGRFEPSSRMCSCGHINHELTLSDRVWTCEVCGLTHDRDLLAANNIKLFGLKNTPVVDGDEDVEMPTVVGSMKRQYIL